MPDINEQALQIAANSVKRGSDVVNQLVSDTVNCYTCDLDELVDSVKKLITSDDDLTIEELESVALKIPVFLYSLAADHEYVGIKVDVSKQVQYDKYSKIYATQSGTSNYRESVATAGTYSEGIIKIVNTRAYKLINDKVEAAYELLNSVKKIITRKAESLRRGEE